MIYLSLSASQLAMAQNGIPDTLGLKAVPNKASINKPKQKAKKSHINLSTQAIYQADDSIIMDKVNQKAYLYHNAMVNYEGVILKAEYIELDFKNNTVYAIGLPDTTGKIIGSPIFKDHGDEYKASTIRYNFETKKGLISDVTKDEGDIYVWLQKGKKMKNNITYVQSGHFTTCSAAHPHYRIRFWKGEIIPNDKIITGPIYMEIEGIPIPLIIPFGFIPNTKGRSNGIIPPTFGYTENRGYSLTQGGYYWGLGDHADLALRGNIYSRGSWGVDAESRYNFRYHGNGKLKISYAFNKYGETDTKGKYKEDKSYFIVWDHHQDPKANPYSTFSANVNFGTTNYNRLNSTNTKDYLTNTFQSSIAYSAHIGDGYNFTGSLNHTQNSQSGVINLTLPQIAFSTPRYNPFKRKRGIGKQKWYEKISLSYKMDARSSVNTTDSLFKHIQWKDFNKGIKQSIPISNTVAFSHFTWTNSMNLTERWYFSRINKYWQQDTIFTGSDSIPPHLVVNKTDGFQAVHEFNYSSSINTRIYGMYLFKKGPIIALRHIITPNLSFSYRPDFGRPPFDYFQEYTDSKGNIIRYSIYEGQMYGNPPDGKSGSINLYFDNNLEMKVHSRKDSVKGTKKIKLIENLRLGTSYNMAAKEFALAPLSLTAHTTIYKKISIRYAAYWDFYATDTTGKRVNTFIWDSPGWNIKQGFLRKNNASWYLSFNYRLSSGSKKKDKNGKYKSNKGTKDKLRDINKHQDGYVDFTNAWNLNLGYTFSYKQTYNTTQHTFNNKAIQSLDIRGSINLTKKWKIGVTSGWDFQANKLTYTSVDIYRDLHCWELLFNWIPMGFNKSYNLTLRIKSPMLQDLKINKKRNWRDY